MAACKQVTEDQFKKLQEFIKPYWAENECYPEAAIRRMRELEQCNMHLRDLLSQRNKEIKSVREALDKAKQALNQIKYVLGDQPTSKQVLDTLRMTQDYERLTGYVDESIKEVTRLDEPSSSQSS